MRAPDIRERNLAKVIESVRALARGRSNAAGSVTLTASAATTAVTADVVSASAGVHLFPATANAAAELGAGTIYVSAVANGSFTLTHANNAQTDRTFFWFAVGG